MYYPEVDIIKNKVPQFEQEVKVENGIIYTIIVNPQTGKKLWVKVNLLKTKYQANEDILERLLWALDNVKIELSMSKAELKRRLIKYSLISK